MKKSKLILSSLVIVLALPLTAHAGGEAVKESEVLFYGGTFDQNATLLAQTQKEKGEYKQKFEECDETLAVIQSIPGCTPGGSGPVATKPKPKKVKKHKKPKSDKEICKSSKYNGKWSHYGWDLSFCDVEASMDGYCLTVKDLHKVDKCLNKRLEAIEELDLEDLIERVEDLEKMEKIAMVDGNYVTPEQLQAVVDMIMAHIKALREVVDELAPEVSKLREDVDALILRMDAIEEELAKLRELVLKHEACLFPEDHPEYYKTDVYGKIDPESYREVCGVLADIPEIKARLDELEKAFSEHLEKTQPLIDEFEECHDPMLPMWEDPKDFAKACPLTRHKMCKVMDRDEALEMVDDDEKRLDAICEDTNEGLVVSHAIGPKVDLVGTFVGDGFTHFYAGALLEWKGLVVKKDGKDLIGFSLFVGALDGIFRADGGITYGARMYVWPGRQDIFGIFLGYRGLSSGIFEPERPFTEDPNNPGGVLIGEPDPDRQLHAGMLGISLGHLWPIKEKHGKLHSFGIEGSLGVGVGWQDDAFGSGVVGVFGGDFGLVYSLTW